MELKLPLETDLKTGWTIDYMFLLKLQKCIGETEDDGQIGLEEIERVTLALQATVKEKTPTEETLKAIEPGSQSGDKTFDNTSDLLEDLGIGEKQLGASEKQLVLPNELLVDILEVLEDSTVTENYRSENYDDKLGNLIDVLKKLTN